MPQGGAASSNPRKDSYSRPSSSPLSKTNYAAFLGARHASACQWNRRLRLAPAGDPESYLATSHHTPMTFIATAGQSCRRPRAPALVISPSEHRQPGRREISRYSRARPLRHRPRAPPRALYPFQTSNGLPSPMIETAAQLSPMRAISKLIETRVQAPRRSRIHTTAEPFCTALSTAGCCHLLSRKIARMCEELAPSPQTMRSWPRQYHAPDHGRLSHYAPALTDTTRASIPPGRWCCVRSSMRLEDWNAQRRRMLLFIARLCPKKLPCSHRP